MSKIHRHFSYANVVATMALAFAMGGSAMAANDYLINSTKQINPKVLAKLKGKRGTAGATGPAGHEGAPGKEGVPGKEGAKGETGPAGTARAFAVVVPDGASTPSVKDAKNITGATRAGAGEYCVAINPAAGINTETVRPIVTVNWNDSATFDVGLFAYDAGLELGCAANSYKVYTAHQKTAGALPIRDDEVAFNIAVP